MHLGLKLAYDGKDLGSAVALAELAERAGLDSVWTAEAYGADAVTLLSFIAGRTSRIGLGTGILQMPARTPANTAMTAMSLDALSGGRFSLGLGVSGPQVVEGWHGVAYGKPLERSREFVNIVRQVLRRDAPVAYDGQTYQVPYQGAGATGLGKALRSSMRAARPDLPVYAPTVFSPHLLPPELGGRPQVRERVFIAATYVGPRRAWQEAGDEPTIANAPVGGWDPKDWNVAKHLPLEPDESIEGLERYQLSEAETHWISVWEELVTSLWEIREGQRLPGFPIWADAFSERPRIPRGTPDWKADFLRKNSEFYLTHRELIDEWLARHDGLAALPASRRKLEWQAQDTASLWETVMHFRPSGIRAKRATYLPALVAITQTSVIGERRRRITPREAARLQGMPDWFEFGDQPDAASYKQLGNAVNVAAAYYVFRDHVIRDASDIGELAPDLVHRVLAAPENPDPVLESRRSTIDLTSRGRRKTVLA